MQSLCARSGSMNKWKAVEVTDALFFQCWHFGGSLLRCRFGCGSGWQLALLHSWAAVEKKLPLA